MMAVLAVCFQAIGGSAEGEARLSVRGIARLVERAYPQIECNVARCHRYLSLVMRDDESDGHPIVEALVRVQMSGWKGEGSLFLPGEVVADELLGAKRANPREGGLLRTK